MSKKLTESTVLETGDKVIPGSVRPDGTVRKERRIRSGYVPQDEQPVYQSRGTLVGPEATCSLERSTGPRVIRYMPRCL
jgi:hypothetical protein